MPELPEVETTLRGIEPHVVGKTIERITIRTDKLRWPIPTEIKRLLKDKEILSVERRAKYIFINAYPSKGGSKRDTEPSTNFMLDHIMLFCVFNMA